MGLVGRRPSAAGAIVTGSHLDSVPDGGGFDGPLGVASALAAVTCCKTRAFIPNGPSPSPLFTEEEGARFGVRLPGQPAADRCSGPGRGPGPDRRRRGHAGRGDDRRRCTTPPGSAPTRTCWPGSAAFVELHVEQGRALAPLDAAIGVAEGIWPHGRWRLDFSGRADHAGTARLADRHDPMLPYASTVLAARQFAAAERRAGHVRQGHRRAGRRQRDQLVGPRLAGLPAPRTRTLLGRTVAAIRSAAADAAAGHGVSRRDARESYTPLVRFDETLRDRIAGVLAAAGTDAPVLPTGAGHDAGILAARIPTAMLFVRNPTGVSHSPAEHADLADCEAGVRALAARARGPGGR